MLEGGVKMIDEKEVKTLEKYQFWKTVLRKEERQNYDENIEFCFSHRTPICNSCSCSTSCAGGCGSGGPGGCSGCSTPGCSG